MRFAAFIIAVLLLAGSVDPTQRWLIALTVVSGIAAIRPRPWAPFRPAFDLRLGVFAIAILLLAGSVEPTRNWLIALTTVAGLAAFAPRLFSFDDACERHDWRARSRRWSREWSRDWRASDGEQWR